MNKNELYGKAGGDASDSATYTASAPRCVSQSHITSTAHEVGWAYGEGPLTISYRTQGTGDCTSDDTAPLMWGDAGATWGSSGSIAQNHDGVNVYIRYVDFGCTNDRDCDGIVDALDVCPAVRNPEQDLTDTDTDGVVDACDNCVNVANAGQGNMDGDGNGDACDVNERTGEYRSAVEGVTVCSVRTGAAMYVLAVTVCVCASPQQLCARRQKGNRVSAVLNRRHCSASAATHWGQAPVMSTAWTL